MRKNYYLSKGNLNEKFENIKLTEIDKNMKSLEDIDIWTSQFDNIEDLRQELINKGLISSTDDICIGTYKTVKDLKKLVPIYNRRLVFKNDLEKLGFNGRTYKSIADELKVYIQSRFNDYYFMAYIINNYYEKYVPKKSAMKAVKKIPIYESGDISILHRVINSDKKIERDEKEYAISLNNFINNELFKCEICFQTIVFDGNHTERIKIFKPDLKQVNIKGLHDLLCHIIDFSNIYYVKQNTNIKKEQEKKIILDDKEEEKEEFLENRDFEAELNFRIDKLGLEKIDDNLYSDDYANSLLLDQKKLVKKIDGI